MSYTIEYSNQFIKSELGITPCWLCGDNNVTENHWAGGRYVERRVRDWSVFCNLLAVTEDELMDKLNSFCGGPYQEHWKRGGKYLDDAAILRWGRNGCSAAVPIEDILSLNHMSSVHCYLSVWSKDLSNTTQLSAYVSTTEELDNWITDARQYIACHPEDHVYPIIEFPRDGFVRVRPESKAKSEDDLVILKKGNAYVTVIEKKDGHITGITYDRDPKRAMVIKRSEAVQAVRSCFRGLRIVSADIKNKPYDVVVRFGAGYGVAGNYYVSSSRKGFKHTWSLQYAKRFPDESAAKHVLTRFSSYEPKIVKLTSGDVITH